MQVEAYEYEWGQQEGGFPSDSHLPLLECHVVVD